MITVTAPAPERTLAALAVDVAADAASGAELHRALLATTVYCERGDHPGFTALGAPGDASDPGLICIYSSVQQLALARGTVGWFTLRGADLLDLLPAGYDLMLDLAGPAPLRLSSATLRRVVAITVDPDPEQGSRS